MPGRKEPLITNGIYHVFNRGIDQRKTFLNTRDYSRAYKSLWYYQYLSPPTKLSKFLTSTDKQKEMIKEKLVDEGRKLIEVLSFCLMPNHFHFLIRQLIDGGISKFMSNFQNSYTRFFNTKRERVGPLFLEQFKAVEVETDEQLLHVSRYIHLNPYSSNFVNSLKDLEVYLWSSFHEFLNPDDANICNTKEILSFFKDPEDYREFVYDQADYQREIERIKHLVIDER